MNTSANLIFPFANPITIRPVANGRYFIESPIILSKAKKCARYLYLTNLYKNLNYLTTKLYGEKKMAVLIIIFYQSTVM
jgi:hypothetical protein